MSKLLEKVSTFFMDGPIYKKDEPMRSAKSLVAFSLCNSIGLFNFTLQVSKKSYRILSLKLYSSLTNV